MTHGSAGHLHEGPKEQQQDGQELQQLGDGVGRLLRPLLLLLLMPPEALAAKLPVEHPHPASHTHLLCVGPAGPLRVMALEYCGADPSSILACLAHRHHVRTITCSSSMRRNVMQVVNVLTLGRQRGPRQRVPRSRH